MNRPTTNDLVVFLKKQHVDSGFINKLKIAYRPYISPFDEILKVINDKDSVFDIGCGSGQFAILLAEFTKVSKVGGIEISNELVKNAVQLMQPYVDNVSFKFQVYDGRTIPEDISQFSVVLLIDVLHHIPADHQVDFITEVYRKMSRDALLIIKDIDAASPLVYFNKLHDLIFSQEIGNEQSSQWINDELSKIGFSIESITRKNLYVYPHYTILARK